MYDLIICDLKMPGIDGAGVYEWIREHKPFMEGRVLFSTGMCLAQRLKDYKQDRRNYIIKPYNVEELLKKLEDILSWK